MLDVIVYDGFTPEQPVTDWIEVDVTAVHNGRGIATITLADDNSACQFLRADTARVTIRYKDGHILSGYVTEDGGDILPNGEATFSIEDDWSLLENPALVNPTGHITPTSLSDPAQAWPTGTQTAGTVANRYGYFQWPEGIRTVEAAVKLLLQRNLVDWLGLPVVVLPDLGRGGDARAAGILPMVRNVPLQEPITDLLTWGGLGLRLWQSPGDAFISCDVYESTVYPQVITRNSGVIESGTWSRKRPTVTDVLVGGPGEDAARAFFLFTEQTGLTAKYGRRQVVFTDATGANLKWPDSIPDEQQVGLYFDLRPEVTDADKDAFRTYNQQAATKTLTAGQATASLAVQLIESGSFYYGGAEGFLRGDSIPVDVGADEPIVDIITEVRIIDNVDKGLTVKPKLGEFVDDPTELLAKTVAGIARTMQRQNTAK